jgi:hypothetical protein
LYALPHRARSSEGAPEVLITAPDPYKLQQYIREERSRQAVVVIREMEMVGPGTWGVLVYQVKPRRKPWVRPAMGLAALAGVSAVVWLLLQALIGALVGLGLATVVGALAVAAVILRLGRPTGSTEVYVRVRNR